MVSFFVCFLVFFMLVFPRNSNKTCRRAYYVSQLESSLKRSEAFLISCALYVFFLLLLPPLSSSLLLPLQFKSELQSVLVFLKSLSLHWKPVPFKSFLLIQKEFIHKTCKFWSFILPKSFPFNFVAASALIQQALELSLV